MKQLIPAILMALFFTSFTGGQEPVTIAFKNNTGKDIKTLKVNIRGKEFFFKDLQQGMQTATITVPATYRYCYAQAITATDTLVCQPEDYVGEKRYTSGKFLMKLISFPSQKYMGMEFEILPDSKP